MAHKAWNIYYLALYGKSLLTPDLEEGSTIFVFVFSLNLLKQRDSIFFYLSDCKDLKSCVICKGVNVNVDF